MEDALNVELDVEEFVVEEELAGAKRQHARNRDRTPRLGRQSA